MNDFKKANIYLDGKHKARNKIIYAFGNSHVHAYGNCVVHAFDESTIYANISTFIFKYNNANVIVRKNSKSLIGSIIKIPL